MGRMLVMAAGVDLLRVKAEAGTSDAEVVAWANAHWTLSESGYEWEVKHRADGDGEVVLRAKRKEAKSGVDRDMDVRPGDREGGGVDGTAECQGR